MGASRGFPGRSARPWGPDPLGLAARHRPSASVERRVVPGQSAPPRWMGAALSLSTRAPAPTHSGAGSTPALVIQSKRLSRAAASDLCAGAPPRR
jgi:hypothetical protein